jgi:hypothetical protein
MLFEKVQATYVGEDGLGHYAERKEGLLIAQNVFMHADGDDLKVERFNPTGNLILIGVGASELMTAQEIVNCFAEIKKDAN